MAKSLCENVIAHCYVGLSTVKVLVLPRNVKVLGILNKGYVTNLYSLMKYNNLLELHQ